MSEDLGVLKQASKCARIISLNYSRFVMEKENAHKSGMSIEDLYQAYINTSDSNEILKIIPDLIDYYVAYGESNFRNKFLANISVRSAERFIPILFNYLIDSNSGDKLIVMDLLKTLYTDAEPDVREKLIYIFYAALLEKHNFKLALAALSFFSHLWKNTEPEDGARAEIFPKLFFISLKTKILY